MSRSYGVKVNFNKFLSTFYCKDLRNNANKRNIYKREKIDGIERNSFKTKRLALAKAKGSVYWHKADATVVGYGRTTKNPT